MGIELCHVNPWDDHNRRAYLSHLKYIVDLKYILCSTYNALSAELSLVKATSLWSILLQIQWN
jgi:hypothetical protein